MHPFDGLDGHLAGDCPAKPRAGLTMVIDWGIGPHRQRDLTAMGADHFDFAKIAVGLSRLHAPELLTEKIDRYLSWDVEPFPRGQYLEYAEVHGLLERYLPACVEAGYRWVEVSEEIRRTIGLSVPNIVAALNGESERPRSKEFGRLFLERADQVMAAGTVVFDAVPGVLEELHSRGVACAIPSTKYRYRIGGILDREGLRHLVGAVVGAEAFAPLALLDGVAQLPGWLREQRLAPEAVHG